MSVKLVSFRGNYDFDYEGLLVRCKVIAIFLNYCLVSPHNTPHARARRVILANARCQRHFKIQIGYFGYCWIPLNAEKIKILTLFFCKRGGLTRLWRNLPIWIKISCWNPFFLWKLPFQSLKSNTTNISLGQHVLQKRIIGIENALVG